ncbi:MAG: hypothetical protein B7Z37_17980 [Verrucomicrobia bacterium 12-59-8]|nr:MAG: hypothetical protein B7Z37_17980 [Verrucomicrobia bacterium 12-59-8]
MRRHFLPCFACLLLAACSEISPTADFRRVQAEFEQTFHSDRLYSGRVSDAPSGYQTVIRSLSTAGIAKLETGQRATAWMMRAVSEWRTGQFSSANACAASGLAADPPAHSREKVLLTLIPALVIDAEVVSAWKAASMAYTVEQYGAVESSYLNALRSLDSAQAVIDSSTPESVRNYFAYQKWRMLFNWETILISLSGDKAAVDQAISRIPPHFNGHDLLDEADAVRQTVPAGDTLRVIMDAEMGSRP